MTEINPSKLLDEVEQARSQLVAMGEGYSISRRDLARKLLAYEKAIGREFLKMVDEAKKSGSRIPAEDIRKAIAHENIDDKIYEQYLVAVADVDIADRLFKIETANLSGLQSELQQLRVEYTHA